ncbi:MAG: hypothetical protein IJC66_06920 [Kiritimatiellae bacterium]|nr:hypothetical protein [Kiritimatiellia bacterium]MBR6586485.1 hypothetical protein [Kiritimatiellia bacterium]
MKKLLLMSVFGAGGLLAVQVNDLAPDFDNAIVDDGFWDTTGHLPLEVTEAASDTAQLASLDSMTSGSGSGAIALFDSRETTWNESDGIARFTSRPVGTVINLR